MEVTLGEEGLKKSWQRKFPKTIKCGCSGEARIGFVAHEGMSVNAPPADLVCHLHEANGKGGLWPHDRCAVAVYLCRDCLKPTALLNQA